VRPFPVAMNRGRADADATKLKVLVIATQKTELAARISMALADAGFRVAALTPHGHPVRRNCSLGPDARIALHPLHQQVER
jgi:hypothetical protein